jgi:hypothetical protein
MGHLCLGMLPRTLWNPRFQLDIFVGRFTSAAEGRSNEVRLCVVGYVCFLALQLILDTESPV